MTPDINKVLAEEVMGWELKPFAGGINWHKDGKFGPHMSGNWNPLTKISQSIWCADKLVEDEDNDINEWLLEKPKDARYYASLSHIPEDDSDRTAHCYFSYHISGTPSEALSMAIYKFVTEGRKEK